MTYTAVLAVHIISACVTGAVIFYTLYVLALNKDTLYRICALVLGLIAAFQVLTGTILAILSPELSAAALSVHIVAYLGVCLGVEIPLFVRMKKGSLLFLLGWTASPVLLSTLVFVAAISYGF